MQGIHANSASTLRSNNLKSRMSSEHNAHLSTFIRNDPKEILAKSRSTGSLGKPGVTCLYMFPKSSISAQSTLPPRYLKQLGELYVAPAYGKPGYPHRVRQIDGPVSDSIWSTGDLSHGPGVGARGF
mmetsp:Transcript_11303/g.24465  ORF Transcript_11303/g.24465 Transcript_11303/m.24465 type:complete len:127 (-) Transcript_11303:197-577(-)